MKYIKYFLVAVSLVAVFVSCDSKLDVSNPNLQTSADFWQNESQIAEGVVAIYNRLLIDGTYMRTLPALMDVRGDDVNSNSPWTLYPLTGNFTIQADYGGDGSGVMWIWRDLYQLIAKANLVFYYAPNVTFSSQDYKNRLLGQAYYLRGLAYYMLAENFQKVPLVIKKPLDQNDYYPATASEDALWSQIISDLKNAQSMLPTSYSKVTGTDQGQTGRATWGAATGLLGKAYLIRKDYSSAATELKKVIDSNLYSLVSNYGDNFTMSNENNSESLFEVQFGNYGTTENWIGDPSSSWKQASSLDYPYGMTAYGAWGDFHPTQWLYSEFKQERCKDGKLDPRLYWTIVSYEPEYDTYTDGRSNTIFGEKPYSTGKLDNTNTTIYIAKYTYARIPGYTAEGGGSRANSAINYRVMRYSEVLLMYAECEAQLGDMSTAAKYVQMVRNRSNLPDRTTEFAAYTKDQFMTQLAHERALELGIESVRFLDVMRWGWLYDATKLAALKSHDSEYNTWVSGHEYLPVPQVELDVNPNLSGNSAN